MSQRTYTREEMDDLVRQATELDVAHLFEIVETTVDPEAFEKIVYFVRCADFVKIGVTAGLKYRLRGLEASNPFPLELLGTQKGGRDLERALHTKFAAHRHRYEWFHLVPEILDYIAALKAEETGT